MRSSSGLLAALVEGGLLEIVMPARNGDDVPGYQLPASVLRWVAGDGQRAFHDPIRVPRAAARRRPDQPLLHGVLPNDRRFTARDGGPRTHGPGALRPAAGSRGAIPLGSSARPVLLPHNGTGDRHRRPERGGPAEHPAHSGQLRPAERPGRAKRPAGAGRILLLDRAVPTTNTSSAGPNGW